MIDHDFTKPPHCIIHPWWNPDRHKCPYCEERNGLKANILQGELLDLISLMPDSQTQEIIDHITELRAIRKRHADSKTDSE